MIKTPFFTLILSTLVFPSTAREPHNPYKPYFFVQTGADLHLNKGDVTNNTNLKDELTAYNTAGYRLGLGYYQKIPEKFFYESGIDYKYVQQKLMVKYNTGRMGFTNSNINYEQDILFNNHYIDPFFRFGYTFRLPKAGSGIDLSMGAVVSIPVSGSKEPTGKVSIPITDDQYNDLIMYTETFWGNQALPSTRKNGFERLTLPVKGVFTMQLSYRTLLGKIPVRAGLDISLSQGNSMNRVEINYFGPARSDRGNSIFADNYKSAGFFLAIGLKK